MCVVSNVGDYWKESFPKKYPWYPIEPTPRTTIVTIGPTQEEFNKLKKEVEDLRELLKAAKIFDEQTNQPDCEMDEKVKFIKEIAKFVGVDMDKVFK